MQGTWQFMSAALVKTREALHTFVDDLESILYVILWLALMYSISSMDAPTLTAFIQSVLDTKQYGGTGGTAKADFLKGRSMMNDLTFKDRPQLKKLLEDLAMLFAVRYEKKPTDEDFKLLQIADARIVEHLEAWKYTRRQQQLRSHHHINHLLTASIQDPTCWPGDDHAKQRTLVHPQEDGKRKVTKSGWAISDRPLKKLKPKA
jgi:hypothetical protein